MKNTIKSLLCAISLIGLISHSQAATSTTTATAASNYSILTNSATVYNIQAQAYSNALTVLFYDSATTNTTYTNAVYVTRYSVLTNLVNIYITTTGITNLMTNYVSYTYNVTNAVGTNNLPLVYSVSVATGQSVSVPVQLNMIRGVAIATSTNGVINLIYERTLGNSP